MNQVQECQTLKYPRSSTEDFYWVYYQKEHMRQSSGVRRNKNCQFQPVAPVQLTQEYMGRATDRPYRE